MTFLFIKQAEVLAAGRVVLVQKTCGCAQSNSMSQFLATYNMAVSKENTSEFQHFKHPMKIADPVWEV